MTPAMPFGGEVIRRASRTTAALQIFAVILLGILVSIYIDISNRQGSLKDAVRENAMWSVYQLDREADELFHSLKEVPFEGLEAAATRERLALRFDIVYSRMDVLRKSKFEQGFSADNEVKARLEQVQGMIMRLDPVFSKLMQTDQASVNAAELLAQASALSEATGALLVYTNTLTSEERAQNRLEVEALQQKAFLIVGLLSISVLLLIVGLRRQLRGVQAAGASLEAMAHELTVSYQAAEAGNRAKSQFMATMGHEIRTPLNAILGMVELLELNKLPEDALSRVKTIRRSGEALLDIINEILDYAKIEHGKLELEERPVDLVTLAENSAEMMRGRATEAGTRISVDLPHRWHARHVLADPTRLRQVMLNLMSNAVKFTSEGTVTLRMRQQVRQNAVWLRVEVQDTGIGIGEEGRKKLFRPFSQVDASISRRYGGTGLGLTICKEIIDRFGGRIGVDSAPGFGSTFWFEVPVQATEAPATEQDVETPKAFARIAPLRILLAEDNKINQQVILGYLGHLGQTAAVAENGQVALELASRQDFDLVLMDMQMPIMDGIEATRRLREPESRNRNVPIVALTANASEEDRRLCRDAGMTGFQAKPISLAALHALLQDVIPVSSSEPGRPVADTTAADHSPESRSGIAAVADRRKEIEDILGADAFEELMAAFFDDAVDLLNSLNVSMQDGRKENFDTLLHNLKGAAANIGLEEIAMQAQTLRKRELTPTDIDELSQQIRAAQTALAA